jgi:hypothetical protein
MTQLFEGCWAKLERGLEHLSTLKSEVARASEQLILEPKLRVNLGRFSLEVRNMPPVPRRWGSIVADVVRNLRGALDNLASALVFLDTRVPEVYSEFPIVDDPGDLQRGRHLETMTQLTAEHRAIIEGAQAYADGYGRWTKSKSARHWVFTNPRQHPLGRLRDLADTDKYGLMDASGLAARDTLRISVTSIQDLDLGRPLYLTRYPLGRGSKVVVIDVTQTGPNPHVEADCDIELYLQSWEARDLVEDLGEIAHLVGGILQTSEFSGGAPGPRRSASVPWREGAPPEGAPSTDDLKYLEQQSSFATLASWFRVQEGTVGPCPQHPCCYQAFVRYERDQDSAGEREWHFKWNDRWEVRGASTGAMIEHHVPEGQSPVHSLVEAVPGTAIDDIAERIATLGFPPPGC